MCQKINRVRQEVRDSRQTWHPWETQNVIRRSRYLCDMVIMTRRIKSSLWGEEIHLLALNYVLNLCGRLVCTCYVTPQILTDRARYQDSECLLAPQVHCHQTSLDCTGSLASSQCASALTNFK